MRVVLVSSSFFPAGIGGGEVQVLSLARDLQAKGHQPIVLTFEDACCHGIEVRPYEYQGIPVFILRAPAERSWYARPRWLVDWAIRWLAEERIDIVHVFLWVHLLGMISAARALRVPVILTALEFGYFCRRFDLLYRGQDLCELDARGRKCENCALATYSWRHRMVAGVARLVPTDAEVALRRAAVQIAGRDLLVALGSRSVTSVIERQRAAFDDEIAAVIAPSTIMRDFYLAQGVRPNKIHLMCYGIAPLNGRELEDEPERGLRAAFIGRLHPAKGLHVLIEATGRLEANLEVSIDIWYPEKSGPPDYVAGLRRKSENDHRIRWRGQLAREQLAKVYSTVDVLVVPSIWYENSPVTIGEALAAGCPVVCSDTKGMGDWIQDGINGLTFPMGDSAALSKCLARIASESDLLATLKRGVEPPPTQERVTGEILALYRQALDEKARSADEQRTTA